MFFGFAYGSSSNRFTIGVVGPASARSSSNMAKVLSNPNLKTESGSRSAEMSRLRDGSIDAVFVMRGSSTGSGTLYYDRGDGSETLAVQGLRAAASGGSSTGVALNLRSVRGISHSRLNFVVAGILATAIMWLGIFAAIPLVQQREQQVLRRFAATPLSRSTLVSAQVVARLIVGLIQAVFILAVARIFFGVPIGATVGGSAPVGLIVVGLLVLLGALSFVAIGYAVAALSSTQHGAHAWAQLLSMPMLLLAGVFFPVAVMPGFLHPLIAILPLTYLADAFRQTAVQGQSFAPLPVDFGVIGAWILVPIAIAVRYFRWS